MSNNFEPPKYWDLLNPDDQHIYREMHHAITAPITKKASRVDDFKEIVDAIDLFENINDDDKWKRCLVCGIFKVKNMIAVNICQLKYLVSKCKSSINGSLRRIGFGKTVKKANVYELLFESIPFLKTNPSELRKWTMRYFTPVENDQNDDEIVIENSDDFLNDDSFFEKKPKEHMTEPEADVIKQNDNDFNFNINDALQPSIFDDKMTNWDNSENIETSDLYFDFL